MSEALFAYRVDGPCVSCQRNLYEDDTVVVTVELPDGRCEPHCSTCWAILVASATAWLSQDGWDDLKYCKTRAVEAIRLMEERTGLKVPGGWPVTL